MNYKYSRKEIIEKFGDKFASTGYFDVTKFFEMMVEPANWPQEGDEFWYIGIHCDPMLCSGYDRILLKTLKKVGNCFRTEKEAVKACNKIRRILNES